MNAVTGDVVLKTSFLRLLIDDVIVSQESLASWADDTRRRNLVRASFAAIEGTLWMTREHILAIASSMELLTPLTEMALREQTYAVNEKGIVIEQNRSTTLRTSIRLIAAQAKLIEPTLAVRFDHHGWEALKQAIDRRNRLTHPKHVDDLRLEDDDLVALRSALRWFMATVEYMMAATTQAYRTWATMHSTLIDALTDGNADALKAYHEAVKRLREDE